MDKTVVAKQKRTLLLLAILFVVLPVLVWAVYQTTPKPPKATNLPLGSVRINPEQIIADLKGKTVYLSALAYDIGGSPISSGVSYQWGISTTNSIGTLIANGTTNLASFQPSATNKGRGDIWVKAFDTTGQTATKSIPVYVGIVPTGSPSATQTPAGNRKPVIWTTQLPIVLSGISYSAMVYGYDENENDVLTMTLTNLPSGITTGPCSSYITAVLRQKVIACQISGTTTTAVKNIINIKIKLNDNKGGSAITTLPLQIIPIATPTTPTPIQTPIPTPTPVPTNTPTPIPTPIPTPTPILPIRVIQPNGGETLSPNQTYSIKWASIPGVNQVMIDLIDGNGAFSTISLPLTASVGQYDWTIPSSWYGTSRQFKIKIYEYPSKTVSDISDDYFSISFP